MTRGRPDSGSDHQYTGPASDDTTAASRSSQTAARPKISSPPLETPGVSQTATAVVSTTAVGHCADLRSRGQNTKEVGPCSQHRSTRVSPAPPSATGTAPGGRGRDRPGRRWGPTGVDHLWILRTFCVVIAPLRGPGQSPVRPFACCVGSLRSVGRCGRCSCWCRFRVRGAPSLVCRGCAGCGGMCRLHVSGAQ